MLALPTDAAPLGTLAASPSGARARPSGAPPPSGGGASGGGSAAHYRFTELGVEDVVTQVGWGGGAG
jgi:hypothetical protein